MKPIKKVLIPIPKVHLKVLLIFLLPVIITGCNSKEDTLTREEEINKIFREIAKNKVAKLEETAVLLSLKYEITNRKVEIILYDYTKTFEPFYYEIVTTNNLEPKELPEFYEDDIGDIETFIKEVSFKSNLDRNIVASIVLDYRFFNYQEDIDNLDSKLEELEYEIEYYHE